jgi:Xaa-Pro aminopeptidase
MYTRRVDAVRQRLAESHLHGLLLTSLPNIRYLSGFSGSNALMLVLPERIVFFTDNRYRMQAPEEVRGAQIVFSSGTLLEALSGSLRQRTRRRLGFEAGTLTVAAFTNLKRLVRSTTFVPTVDVVERVRAIKDDEEVAKIQRAAGITDRVFRKILSILQPGIRELDLAAEISYGFEPIVASGDRGALPHARATSKKIGNREMVTIDIGCKVDGYHCDVTRTISVGRPRTELAKIYTVVLDAQKKALFRAKDGVAARSVDRVARATVSRAGYGKYFRHSTGHGVGLEVHELPRVSSRSKDLLMKGTVLTVEPGIYVPGLGGVRIEDDAVVGEDGCRVLSNAEKELVIL